MRTIITREIDGYTVVMGIDKPVIDAVTTRTKIDDSIKSDPMVLEIAGKCSQAVILAKKWNKSRKKRRLAAQTQTLDEQYMALCLEISKLKKQVDEKRFKMSQDDPIYFQPKPGEFIISDDEAEEYRKLMKGAHHAVALLEKKYALDYRDLNYWHKKNERWENCTIEKLGETPPDEYYTFETLTEKMIIEIRSQMRDDQILEMSPEEKEQAVKDESENVLTQAAIMKNKLEITNHGDPAGETKRWYKRELERIEKRYA